MNLLEGIALQDVLDALSRRWYVVILTGLIAGIVAYVLSSTQPPIYRATVVLLARPNRADYSLDLFLKARLNSYRATLTSYQLAGEVIRRAKLDMTPADVVSEVKVTPNPEDSTIVVTVDDRLPEQAQAIANALADAFVERIQAENLALPPTDLKVDIQKIDVPAVPNRPVSPNRRTDTLAGLILGATVGLLTVLLWAVVDRTIKRTKEVENLLGLPVLAVIPPPYKTGKWPAGKAADVKSAVQRR